MTIKNEDASFIGHFREFVLNDAYIDWGYWVGQMPRLDAAQAARLINGLDPDIFADLDNRPNTNNPADACSNARSMERLAIACGMNPDTPRAWLDWADKKGFKVHELFRSEAEYRAEYVKAAASLEAGDIEKIEKSIKQWEMASAVTVGELKEKERTLANLNAKLDELKVEFSYWDSQQQAPEPQAAPVVADKAGPVTVETKNKRRGWRDVTWPYLLEVFQSGKYSTAKEFYKALERKAGADSPFELGTGSNRDSLFIPEISQTLKLKTVQNTVWKELREIRQTG